MQATLAPDGSGGPPAGEHSQRTPIPTALVGCGPWGLKLARAASGTGAFDVVAAVDLVAASADAARRALGCIWSSTDPADVWRDDHVEAVLVASPASTHFAIATQALTAMKHVLVEKPLAASVVQCEELAVIAAGTERILMVGHTFMYSSHVAAVRDALNARAIGDLYYMHLRRLAFGRFRQDVNVIWNLGPHDVSILNYWSGLDPVRVRCVEQDCTRAGLADIAFITIDYGAFLGQAHLSCVDPMRVRDAKVAGSIGGISYDDVTKQVVVTTRGSVGTSSERLTVDGPSPLEAECRHFAQCIRDRTSPRTDVSHAISVTAVLEAAGVSAARGGMWIPVETTRAVNRSTRNRFLRPAVRAEEAQ